MTTSPTPEPATREQIEFLITLGWDETPLFESDYAPTGEQENRLVGYRRTWANPSPYSPGYNTWTGIDVGSLELTGYTPEGDRCWELKAIPWDCTCDAKSLTLEYPDRNGCNTSHTHGALTWDEAIDLIVEHYNSKPPPG